MYFKNEIQDEYRNEFNRLNITNEDDMLTILNGLDMIAEIGYTLYNKNKISSLYD